MHFAEIKTDSFDALPFVLYTVGENDHQPPIFRPDGFRWHEFIWVKQGSGTFTVREESFFLTEGQGIFILRDVPHSYVGDPMSTRWCTFSADERILRHVLGDRECLPFDCPPSLQGETDSLIRAANSSGSLLARSAAGYSFVSDLFLKITESSVPTEVKVSQYLEAHYADSIALDDVAAAVGMNRYMLCRLYREKKGISVMENLKKIRIAKAKRFLRYGAESVSEVGRLCGFDSASYFIRRFREECGCTPREYRERHTAETAKK